MCLCSRRTAIFLTIALFILAIFSFCANVLLFFPNFETKYAAQNVSSTVWYFGGIIGSGMLMIFPACVILKLCDKNEFVNWYNACRCSSPCCQACTHCAPCDCPKCSKCQSSQLCPTCIRRPYREILPSGFPKACKTCPKCKCAPCACYRDYTCKTCPKCRCAPCACCSDCTCKTCPKCRCAPCACCCDCTCKSCPECKCVPCTCCRDCTCKSCPECKCAPCACCRDCTCKSCPECKCAPCTCCRDCTCKSCPECKCVPCACCRDCTCKSCPECKCAPYICCRNCTFCGCLCAIFQLCQRPDCSCYSLDFCECRSCQCNRKSPINALIFAVIGVMGAAYGLIVSSMALKIGPLCRVTQLGEWRHPFKRGDYLNDPSLWIKCLEPENVIFWHILLFSILLSISAVEFIICVALLINILLTIFCGDTCYFKSQDLD